jgi:PD-(D/E)XK nuclease superfamily
MSGPNNLLIALHTYTQQDENFTTEALVHFLRFLQTYEPGRACALVAGLTGGLVTVSDEEIRSLAITTQKHFSTGTPDILISGLGYYVFVEVKVEADPGWNQLDKYREILDKRREAHRYLVLLSRYTVDPVERAKADKHVRWHSIAQIIALSAVTTAQTAVAAFLTEQFLAFLRERGMAMERVGWELTRGMQSLRSLVSMLEEALGSSKQVEKIEANAGKEWNGFKFLVASKQCWSGVYYSRCEIAFEAYDVNKEAFNRAGIGGHLVEKGSQEFGRWDKQSRGPKWVNTLDLESENVHFFALSPEGQQKNVDEFVAESISATNKLNFVPANAGS